MAEEVVLGLLEQLRQFRQPRACGGNSFSLFHTITPKLRKQIEKWAQSDEQWIAPYLNRRILQAAA